ncbi:MAG: 4Fe-4S cluster-binding domain-containing protein [Helicobacteraceae bacterium]|nr:4Fe-4S cluster-binding domain-containing protein [Helicobacteraceae bacterium]
MLYLVESFFSIQGEGKYVGTPSVFFRFGGCNLRCEGFGCEERLDDGSILVGCDTLYAVDREAFSSSWEQIQNIDELLSILDKFNAPEGVDVVLTGGEPLIYANDQIFIAFLKELHRNNHRVTFETNATIKVNFEKNPIFKEAIYALSIKLSNSDEPYEKRVKREVFENIIKNSKESFFKFSVDKKTIKETTNEIDEIINSSLSTTTYCMPLGGSEEEINQNTEAVIDLCKKRNFIYSDRLHIRIWDQNRGV